MGKETEVNSKNCHNCPIRTNDEYGNNICGLVLNLSIDLEVNYPPTPKSDELVLRHVL